MINRVLSLILLLALGLHRMAAQTSPHGPLSRECSDCHSTGGWTTLNAPMHFDHSKTSYPLEGSHRTASCRGCHISLVFKGISHACVSCHLKQYESATAIVHPRAGFSTECSQCHTVRASWRASFDHNRTQFATRGAHEAVACNACHLGDRYRGTPVLCVSCHMKEYVNSTTPNHAAAKFSTDCAVCHRALTWTPAAFFPHDAFPIGAGATHRPGTWRSCVDCHAAQPNYATFECINCHQHSKSRTDSNHSEVRNYTYQSSACYRCHPQGSN